MTVDLPVTITTRHSPTPEVTDPLGQASVCAVCPKLCRTTCPVESATGRESYAPWRISQTVVDAQRDGWTEAHAETVAGCTGCGACSRACLVGVSLPDEVRSARAVAAAAGFRSGAAAELAAHIATLPASTARAGSSAALIGCGVQRRRPEIGAAAVRLFAAAGESIAAVTPEPCCGAIALDLGLPDEARRLATDAAGVYAEAEQVVVLSPGCARMVRDEWPRIGLRAPAVVTSVEWLADVLADGRLPTPSTPAGAVAWHDPCTLTRGLGVVEPQRAALRALGAEILDPLHTGLDTRCSGGGAALPLTLPDVAAQVADARKAELDELAAPAYTACPTAGELLDARDLLELAADVLLGPAG